MRTVGIPLARDPGKKEAIRQQQLKNGKRICFHKKHWFTGEMLRAALITLYGQYENQPLHNLYNHYLFRTVGTEHMPTPMDPLAQRPTPIAITLSIYKSGRSRVEIKPYSESVNSIVEQWRNASAE